ncbi:MAG TPA: cache domain-containing protein, partial [Albitalea sp.]|nr:cache domain-containing protein [Albitalea sp.]
AKALAERANEYVKKVGPEQAFKDFTTDKAKWNPKDMYVFAGDMNATVVAHGQSEKFLGKNLMELKDQNGKAFVKEFIDVAKTKGSGWVEYDWINPQTKKVEPKVSYVLKLSSFDGIVIVGVYR